MYLKAKDEGINKQGAAITIDRGRVIAPNRLLRKRAKSGEETLLRRCALHYPSRADAPQSPSASEIFPMCDFVFRLPIFLFRY